MQFDFQQALADARAGHAAVKTVPEHDNEV